MIEGDTALTPDQGRTSGSAGMQVRRHADPAGGGDRAQGAASRWLRRGSMPRPPISSQWTAKCGRRAGGAGIAFADAGRRAGSSISRSIRKAPLKDPASYTIVGKPLPRPDVPAKVTGSRIYVHDFTLPGMLHGRVIRPPAHRRGAAVGR